MVDTEPAEQSCNQSNDYCKDAGQDGLVLNVSWNGQKFTLEVKWADSVRTVKEKLFNVTNVLPDRQKLIGLHPGKLPDDEAILSDLRINERRTLLLLGTTGELIQCPPILLNCEENGNNATSTQSNPARKLFKPRKVLYEESVRLILDQTAASAVINFFSLPRQGTKLLVLDIDYTIYDCKTVTDNILDAARPGLHDFLRAIFPYYDICIWSQTSWSWLTAKLRGLELLGRDDFSICFALDRSSMFQVSTVTGSGSVRQHEVKALDVIWRKVPGYHEGNTVHVDDLGRNFALNPKSGIKIKSFKNALVTREQDRELFLLRDYLLKIKDEEDLSGICHVHWASKAEETDIKNDSCRFEETKK